MKKRVGILGVAAVGVGLQARGVHSADFVSPQEGSGKKVAVVGAGAVGLLQGYQLAKKGYDVTIIDARDNVSQGCTAAAAGLFSTQRRLPDWGTVLPESNLYIKNKKFILSQIKTPEFWSFFPQFAIQTLQLLIWPTAPLRESTESCNTLMRQAPELFSSLVAEVPGIANFTHKGWLKVYRTGTVFEAAKENAGDECIVLDGFGAVKEFDPIAAPEIRHHVIGGLYYPDGLWALPESICKELAGYMQTKLGVKFIFSSVVQKLLPHPDGEKYSLVMAGNKTRDFDLIVLCGGVGSSALAKATGKRVPVYPLRGNTMTIDGSRAHALPKDGMLLWDVESHCGLGRSGNTVRVSAQGEFSQMPSGPAYQEHTAYEMRTSLQEYVMLMLPLEQEFKGVITSGDRPITPDWAPIIGHLDKNVWINTGHGTAGWTMSFASAAALSDYIETGEAPEVLDSLSPNRFQWF